MDIQIQEAHRTPTRINPKRPTPRLIINKLSKGKKRESRKQQEKSNSHQVQGYFHKIISKFPRRNLTGHRGMG